MSAAIADTHTTIWYAFADARLSRKAKKTFEKASNQGLYVAVSSITLAEIIYLMEKNRIPSETFVRLLQVLRDSKKVLKEVSIDGQIIEVMAKIPRDDVSDLPDRIIAATAKFLDVPVITRDRKIQSSELQSIW